MNINPLWSVCILTRLLLICLLNKIPLFVPLLMGIGFMYKGLTGSNDEVQVTQVFWHDTRYVHGTLYLLATYYMFRKNIKMASIILLLDVFFSFLYRIKFNV